MISMLIQSPGLKFAAVYRRSNGNESLVTTAKNGVGVNASQLDTYYH